MQFFSLKLQNLINLGCIVCLKWNSFFLSHILHLNSVLLWWIIPWLYLAFTEEQEGKTTDEVRSRDNTENYLPLPVRVLQGDENNYHQTLVQRKFHTLWWLTCSYVNSPTIHADTQPPILEPVFAIPKIVPEKFGAISRPLPKYPAVTAPFKVNAIVKIATAQTLL